MVLLVKFLHYPPKKIAKILGDLDEKIELNHQMNKTLESIAQKVRVTIAGMMRN